MIPVIVLLSLVAGADSSAAYVANALAHHRRADVLERRGAVNLAVAEMKALTEENAPEGPQILDLQLDAWGRLADLLVKSRSGREAEAAAREGLIRAKNLPDSALIARLWVALGDAFALQRKDQGAVAAYQTAIEMTHRLLVQAAKPDGGQP